MENPVYIGLSRQAQLRREMALIANNVANMDTTAFKRQMNINQAYDQRIRYGEKLAFVIDIGSALDMQEGGMEITGNAFDMGIKGPGFFMIDDGTDIKYSRGGSFSLDAENRMITQTGDLVLDENERPIVLPGGGQGLSVGQDGLMTYEGTEYGRLGIVEFERPADLQPGRNGLFTTDQVPLPPENTRIAQGTLEQSNVKPITEMTTMIDVHRTYDSVKRFMDQENERQKDIVKRLARPLQGS